MIQRGGFMSTIPTGVKQLLLANIVLFFLTSFMKIGGVNLNEWLGLHLTESSMWYPWQYITSMFMHGGFSHLFFNMFALFMFGRILEQVWGTKRFVTYYMLCGLGAGLLHNFVSWMELGRVLEPCREFAVNATPEALYDVAKHLGDGLFKKDVIFGFIDQWQQNPSNPVYIAEAKQMVATISSTYTEIVENTTTVGASGAVFGILLAFGMLFPNTEMYIMFLPIPIKAKYFVAIYALIELFAGVQHIPGDNVAHFAHLGGMLIGFIILKIWRMRRNTFY